MEFGYLLVMTFIILLILFGKYNSRNGNVTLFPLVQMFSTTFSNLLKITINASQWRHDSQFSAISQSESVLWPSDS